ncbi:hypothetical protein [Actinoplanes sp. HUAS TT8]|uniref:hypothetical protein n=1 Tax=Actinoplanes sp. HUAS TT8 TaxID=3447453 RepID=UPI003F51E2A8
MQPCSGLSTSTYSLRLAAGALMFASTYVIDELFQDLKTLAGDGGTVADGDGFFVLDDLPERFARHYGARFAHKFLVATVSITGRLSAQQWAPLASVAEALALHLVVERAKWVLIDHEILADGQVRNLYADFQDAAFDDIDHELLYQAQADGFEDDDDLNAQLGLAVAEVAKRLRVSARWLGNQCRSGLVEHVFLARKRSFTEDQVQKLLDAYTVTTPKQAARDKSTRRIAARVRRDRTGLR